MGYQILNRNNLLGIGEFWWESYPLKACSRQMMPNPKL